MAPPKKGEVMTDVKLCFVLRSEHVALAMNLMQPYCKVATIEGVTEAPPFEEQILDTSQAVAESKPRRKAAAQAADTVISASKARDVYLGKAVPVAGPGSAGTRHEAALQVLRRHGEPMEPKAFHDEVIRVTKCDRRGSYNTLAYLKLTDQVRMVRGKISPK